MKFIPAAIMAASLGLTANAALFFNPTIAPFPAATPAVLGPLVGVPLVSSVLDDAGNFAATLTTTVHSGGSNPLGGLTFVYTLSNDLVPPSNADDLIAFAVRWDPAYVPAVLDVDTAPSAGISPSVFAFGPNSLAFLFSGALLPAGSSSVAIAIGTSATAYTLSDAGIINTTTEDARALVPVPEPGEWSALAAIGMLGYALVRRHAIRR